MTELIFYLALWAYPGLAAIYGFWAILHFGAKNTMSEVTRNGRTYPDWIIGLHFLCQSVAFYLLYFATKDLPITANSFFFVIRMWWAAAFLTGLAITLWHFGILATRQRRHNQDRDQSNG